MKIVCVLGSPRARANSSIIAERFCTTAENLGAEVLTFTLNDLDFQVCQACMACKTKLDRCILEDDLTEVLEAVRETDVLVVASPVYYGEVSSQLKGFIDRTYSYLVPDHVTKSKKSRLASGKTLVFVLVQGNPDEKPYADIFPRYEHFFRYHGFDESHLIRACGVRLAGEVEDRPELLALAEETARRLFSN